MAKGIMIQGTMSDVGKSIIATGLCRIFAQDGYKVAPFKGQNMASNSYITENCLEMGQSQGTQSEAAGLIPHPTMNPVLLKPQPTKGSQMFLEGKLVSTLSAPEYNSKKQGLLDLVEKSYYTLAYEKDIIVLEGAGSPVELNLKDNDITNMGLAQRLNCPVLLVGDIDRGGIFATLYGTVALYSPLERGLLKGCIINKFKGNPSILNSSFQRIEELTKVPLLGLVPSLDLDLTPEDGPLNPEKTSPFTTTVASILSFSEEGDIKGLNFLRTQIPLELSLVRGCADFYQPNLVIIPTITQPKLALDWLEEKGLLEKLKHYSSKGGRFLSMGEEGFWLAQQLGAGKVQRPPTEKDSGEFFKGFYAAVGARPPKTKESYQEYKERQYDLIADTLRQQLNMEVLYEIVFRG